MYLQNYISDSIYQCNGKIFDQPTQYLQGKVKKVKLYFITTIVMLWDTHRLVHWSIHLIILQQKASSCK